MVEALSAQQLLAAGASGALMVLFGAFYAFFFAINRLRPSPYWPIATYSSFALLVVCSIVLTVALKLTGFWQLVIGFVLVCYYFSTHFIWRLSVATHTEEHSDLHHAAEPSKSLETDGGSA